jgi:RNA polymerase-binding transcription factor DksA
MATRRSPSTRRKASSGKKRAGAKRAVAAKKKVMKKTPKKTAKKPVKKAVKKPVKKVVAKKVVAKKVVAKKAPEKKAAPKKVAAPAKPAKAVAKPAVKAPIKAKSAMAPAPAAKAEKGKAARGSKPVRMPKPEPVVRPLGVLPLESRAKGRRLNSDSPRVAFPEKPSHTGPTTPVTQGAERLSEQDMKVFEERLLADRQKILREMGHLENTVLKVNQRESSGDLSGYSFHMADAGTDAMEREKAFLFASAEGRLLFEINDALRRLYNGEYGSCESCGQTIARARLEAMPHARQCVPCKSKEERAGRSAL